MTVNKKTFIATIIITAILFSLEAGMLVVRTTEANFAPYPVLPPKISIIEPENSSSEHKRH